MTKGSQVSPCDRCQLYQQTIRELEDKIYALEVERGLHETLPYDPSGKRPSHSFKQNGKLNDTVSFPKKDKYYEHLGAKPKRRHNVAHYPTPPGIKLTNRFSPLSEHNENKKQRENCNNNVNERSHEVKTAEKQRTVPNVKAKADTLLIGDGAISNININKMMTVSFRGATVTDITRLLPEQLQRFNPQKLVVHVGAMDIREEESEVLKKNFNNLFESLKKVSIPTFISGPLPNIDRRINKFSRLLQLNTWLSRICEKSESLNYIDNFNLFWNRDDLFKGKGPHLNREGVKRLADNILHALRHQVWRGQETVLPQREKRTEISTPRTMPPDCVTTAPLASSKKDVACISIEPASLPKDLEKDSGTAAQPEPPEKYAAAAAVRPAYLSSPSSRSIPQDWVPPATSSPSRNDSLLFPSPPSPLGLPQCLDPIIKSGLKMVPLTPTPGKSRIKSPKKYRAPLPPQFTPQAKGFPARPPPQVPTAANPSSITVAL